MTGYFIGITFLSLLTILMYSIFYSRACRITPKNRRADQRTNAFRFPHPSLLNSSINPQHQQPIIRTLMLRKSLESHRLTLCLLSLPPNIFYHSFLPQRAIPDLVDAPF